MAFGQKAFRKIQLSNPEDTPGVAEVATEVAFGVLEPNTTDKIFHTPEQDRGVLAQMVEQPFEVSRLGELSIEGELYDRLANFMFSNSIRGNVTPTQPDNINRPNEWLWFYEPALTVNNTPDETDGIDTFTIEFGDNVQSYEMDFSFTVSLTIEGTVDEPVNFTWEINGQEITDSTFTPALTDPSAAYFAFNQAKFFIDSNYAAIGTTQKLGMLRAFTWTFETMFTARFAADGSLVFSGVNEDVKTVSFEPIYYRDGTNSEAEKDKFDAQDLVYVRVTLESGTEMDSGEANPEYIHLDMALRYTEWPTLSDEAGTHIESPTANAVYDATSAKMMGVSVGTTMVAFA
jgi:hypothetical protein